MTQQTDSPLNETQSLRMLALRKIDTADESKILRLYQAAMKQISNQKEQQIIRQTKIQKEQYMKTKQLKKKEQKKDNLNKLIFQIEQNTKEQNERSPNEDVNLKHKDQIVIGTKKDLLLTKQQKLFCYFDKRFEKNQKQEINMDQSKQKQVENKLNMVSEPVDFQSIEQQMFRLFKQTNKAPNQNSRIHLDIVDNLYGFENYQKIKLGSVIIDPLNPNQNMQGIEYGMESEDQYKQLMNRELDDSSESDENDLDQISKGFKNKNSKDSEEDKENYFGHNLFYLKTEKWSFNYLKDGEKKVEDVNIFMPYGTNECSFDTSSQSDSSNQSDSSYQQEIQEADSESSISLDPESALKQKQLDEDELPRQQQNKQKQEKQEKQEKKELIIAQDENSIKTIVYSQTFESKENEVKKKARKQRKKGLKYNVKSKKQKQNKQIEIKKTKEIEIKDIECQNIIQIEQITVEETIEQRIKIQKIRQKRAKEKIRRQKKKVEKAAKQNIFEIQIQQEENKLMQDQNTVEENINPNYN